MKTIKHLALLLMLVCSAAVSADEVMLPSLQYQGSPLIVPFDFPVAATLDGKYIATASKTPGRVVVVDTASGVEVMQLQGGLLPITSMRFSPDDQSLLGGDERRVYVWNLQSKKLVAACPAQDATPGSTKLMQFAIAGNGSRFVTAISRHVQGEGSQGVTYQSWNMGSGAEEWSRHIAEPPYQLEYRMCVSHDGTILVHWPGITPNQDGSTTIHLWKIVPRVGASQQASVQDKSLTIKDISPVQCVAFTPGGKELIITGSRNQRVPAPDKAAQPATDKDPLVLIYHPESLQESGRWNTRMTMPMSRLVFHRDGSLMAGFDSNWYELGIWETRSGKSLGMAKRDPYKNTFWPRIWDLRFNQNGQVQCSISNGQAENCQLQPRPDGGLLAFPAPNLPPNRPHSSYINSVAFSPDQKQLLTFDGGMLCTWDLSNLALLRSARVGPPIRKFVMKRGVHMTPGGWASLRPIISSDGRFLVTQGLNAHLLLNRLQTNEEYQLNLDLTEKQGMQVALRAGFTPDGKRVVAEWTEFQGYGQNAKKDGRVEAWETEKGTRVWSRPVLQLASDESRSSNIQYLQQPLSFTSDSRSVAISGGILDVATGQQKSDWGAPLPRMRSGCFDPSGKCLISFDDSTFRYWDVDTGKLLEEWALPYNSDYRLLRILPDGRTALIAVPPTQWPSDNASSQIQWVELASHQIRARFAFEHQFPFALMGVSPDGNTLVGTNKSNGLAIWRVRTPPKQMRLASKQEMEQHWKKVCDISAGSGWKAMLALADDPDQTIPFVMEQLKQRPTSEQIQAWIEELGHSDFQRRERAGEKLSNLGKSVERLLRTALKTDSIERLRRVELLLQAIPEVDTCRLRDARTVELLEMIGNAEAKKMLAQLANGTQHERVTQDAQASLRRLALQK